MSHSMRPDLCAFLVDWLRYEHVMTTIWDLQNDVVRLLLELLGRPWFAEVERVTGPESYVALGKG